MPRPIHVCLSVSAVKLMLRLYGFLMQTLVYVIPIRQTHTFECVPVTDPASTRLCLCTMIVKS